MSSITFAIRLERQRTLELVRAAGSDGWAFDADVGSSTELDALFEKIADAGMRLEVLVNNAAVQTFRSIDGTERDKTGTARFAPISKGPFSALSEQPN